MEARRPALAFPVGVRVPLPVGASGVLALAFVTYTLWAGDLRQSLTVLLVFGGLFVTSVVARIARPEQRIGRLVQAGYPLLFWPLLYQQAVDTVMLDPTRYIDPVLMRFDVGIVPWTTACLGGPVEELASLFYVSYYLLLPLGFLLAWRRSADDASRYTTALLVAFTACALLWLVVPAGGLHAGGSPTGPAYGPFTMVARSIYAANPHFAAAFPSSHVALSVAAAAMLHRSGRGRWVFLWALGVAIATVVGQYHYSLDAVAGWGVGWLASRRAGCETDWVPGSG